MKKYFTPIALTCLGTYIQAQNIQNNPKSNHGNRFEQLGTILPTPSVYRTASGAPGAKYWQQKTDYTIKAYLDEKNLSLTGEEQITYHNNSPDSLEYIWIQLDENEHSATNNANYQFSSKIPDKVEVKNLQVSSLNPQEKDNKHGVQILEIKDAAGKDLSYFINKTMMRVDLPQAIEPGKKMVFSIKWKYNLVNRLEDGGRGGYEYFPEDGNHLFTITQWYPRMCVYSDFKGWQNAQFTGRGEFALTFGDFSVEINVPSDHIVAGTGEIQNPSDVLSSKQLQRYQAAKSANEPIEIVTLDEAKTAEKTKSSARKLWKFKANNVRDFAWTSSRKFIWDGMAQPIKETGKSVLCMSLYPKEAYGIYRKFSTRAVAHTVKTYSDFTIPFPYPVAQSIEAANGMEYPMICFNYGRTEKDGTYSESIKNGMLGVVIHEVGHNFFPMIINSDERQWSWMDEGLNTFVEYLTEELWDNNFPSKRGPAWTITDYMKLPKDQLEPIMTNSENINQFGPNAYSKPATGLNILRETIMGRELFDKAFKTYSKRWAFKHPEPGDFFRTMEDASGEDLDWFWRGWFYDTEPVDLAITEVKIASPEFPESFETYTRKYTLETPQIPKFRDISKERNKEIQTKSGGFYVDKHKEVQDFYYEYSKGNIKIDNTKEYTLNKNSQVSVPLKDTKDVEKLKMYQIKVENVGGLVMPIILKFTFADGSSQTEKIPAQIWRKNEKEVYKTYTFAKELSSIQLDPMRETADIDESNNMWSLTAHPSPESRFQVFMQKEKAAGRGESNGYKNPMQEANSKVK